MAAGGDDDTGAMRRQLQKESAKTPNGAAFRWAVGAAPNGFLELQLQSLPLPAALVNGKPMLRQDDIAVVVIKAWQIQNEAFDKIGGLAGPVPVLFTAQPEELRTKIERDPDSFFAELNKFMARYKHSFLVKSRTIILIPSGIFPFCCSLRIRILLYPHGYIPINSDPVPFKFFYWYICFSLRENSDPIPLYLLRYISINFGSGTGSVPLSLKNLISLLLSSFFQPSPQLNI